MFPAAPLLGPENNSHSVTVLQGADLALMPGPPFIGNYQDKQLVQRSLGGVCECNEDFFLRTANIVVTAF